MSRNISLEPPGTRRPEWNASGMPVHHPIHRMPDKPPPPPSDEELIADGMRPWSAPEIGQSGLTRSCPNEAAEAAREKHAADSSPGDTVRKVRALVVTLGEQAAADELAVTLETIRCWLSRTKSPGKEAITRICRAHLTRTRALI